MPEIRRDYFSICYSNGENAAGGFGITEDICEKLFSLELIVLQLEIMFGIRETSILIKRIGFRPLIFQAKRLVKG